jgi:hypothetical protein
MAKKKRMSSEGKEFLDDLKYHIHKGEAGKPPASLFESYSRKYNMTGPLTNYFEAHDKIARGKEDHLTKIDKSNLTDYDLAEINSYISTLAEKDLKWNERLIKHYADSVVSTKKKDLEKDKKKEELSALKRHLDLRIKNSANAIKYLNEHGDKLQAKDFAIRLGKIIHPVYMHGEKELYEAAKIDKESRKDEFNRKKSNLEDSVNYWASILTFGGFTLSLLFLSPTLTGNAIANLSTRTSSLVGSGLFFVGLVGTYLWFKKP